MGKTQKISGIAGEQRLNLVNMEGKVCIAQPSACQNDIIFMAMGGLEPPTSAMSKIGICINLLKSVLRCFSFLKPIKNDYSSGYSDLSLLQFATVDQIIRRTLIKSLSVFIFAQSKYAGNIVSIF